MAGSQYGMYLVIVNRHENLFNLEPIYNFHEGGDPFILHPDGSVTIDERDSPYISNLSISVLSQDSFRLGFDDPHDPHTSLKPTDYVFVQKAEAYIGKIVLVGKYKDRRGRSYEFGEDGWAVFPDRKFKFEIGLDHVWGTHLDYFFDEGQTGHPLGSSIIAFKWDGRMLQLFRTQEDKSNDEVVPDRHPYLILQPTR
jgi:hypothetical protein